jgi:hypothetical protein
MRCIELAARGVAEQLLALLGGDAQRAREVERALPGI